MVDTQTIIRNINNPDTKLVYVSVGCEMGSYPQILDKDNQQYPPFIAKFDGHKVIILYDPYLEEKLAIQKYWEAHNDSLELISTHFDQTNTRIQMRILRNRTVTVYAITDGFYFEKPHYSDHQLQREMEIKTDSNISFIHSMIIACLEKQEKTKFILQDFTGRDTTSFYLDLFESFPKNELLSNVMFDVTQKDSGCFIQMDSNLAEVDSSNNFIQEKYLELTKVPRSKLSEMVRERVAKIIYPFSYTMTSLYKYLEQRVETHQIDLLETARLFGVVYNIAFDSSNTLVGYLVEKYEEILNAVLNDLCVSRDFDRSTVDTLQAILKDDPIAFINSMTLFNYQTD